MNCISAYNKITLKLKDFEGNRAPDPKINFSIFIVLSIQCVYEVSGLSVISLKDM